MPGMTAATTTPLQSKFGPIVAAPAGPGARFRVEQVRSRSKRRDVCGAGNQGLNRCACGGPRDREGRRPAEIASQSLALTARRPPRSELMTSALTRRTPP